MMNEMWRHDENETNPGSDPDQDTPGRAHDRHREAEPGTPVPPGPTGRRVAGPPAGEPEVPGMRLRTMSRILQDDPDALELPAEIGARIAYAARVTLLSGREKGGKSTLASALAAAVTTGTSFLDGVCKAGLVVYLKLEEADGDLIRRLDAFGADGENLIVGDRMEDVPGAYARMIKALRPSLVIVDTLTDYAALHENHPQSGDSAGWNKVVTEIREPARATGTAVLILHHQSKRGESRDSTAIPGSVDLVLEMTERRGGERHIASRGRWDTEDFTVRLEGNEFRLAGATRPLAEQIIHFLTENGPSSKNAIRVAVAGRNARIDAELEGLLVEGRVVEVSSAGRYPRFAVPGQDMAA